MMLYSKGDILKVDNEIWIVLDGGISLEEFSEYYTEESPIPWIWPGWKGGSAYGACFGLLSIKSITCKHDLYQIMIGDEIYWTIGDNLDSIPMERVRSEEHV